MNSTVDEHQHAIITNDASRIFVDYTFYCFAYFSFAFLPFFVCRCSFSLLYLPKLDALGAEWLWLAKNE